MLEEIEEHEDNQTPHLHSAVLYVYLMGSQLRKEKFNIPNLPPMTDWILYTSFSYNSMSNTNRVQNTQICILQMEQESNIGP